MREVIKAIVDGTSVRLLEEIGAAVLYTWLLFTTAVLSFKHTQWIYWAIIFTIVLWLILTRFFNKIGCAAIVPSANQIRLPDSGPVVSTLGESMDGANNFENKND